MSKTIITSDNAGTVIAPESQGTVVAPSQQGTVVAPMSQGTVVAPVGTTVAPSGTVVAGGGTVVAGTGAPVQQEDAKPTSKKGAKMSFRMQPGAQIMLSGKVYTIVKGVSSGTEAELYVVNDGGDDKEEVLVIKFNKAASATTKLEINLDGVVCELKARDDGKHENKLKYKEVLGEEEKALFASVKYSAEDDDFKLVDANDKLLWKVKVFSEKVKISDNEEGNNYYQIKKNKKGKIKIYNQGEEEKNCGVVKYKEGKLKVKAVVNEEEKEDLYSCKELDDIYFAPGVLMLDKIPARERAIIVTELLRKGK